MGTFGAMMSRMMKTLAKSDEVKESSTALSSRMDEVTMRVDHVATRVETIEDDVKNFAQQVQKDIEAFKAALASGFGAFASKRSTTSFTAF